MTDRSQFFCAGCQHVRYERGAIAYADVYPDTVDVLVCLTCYLRVTIDPQFCELVEKRCEVAARVIATKELSDKIGIPLTRLLDPTTGMVDMDAMDRMLGLPPGTTAIAAPYLAMMANPQTNTPELNEVNPSAAESTAHHSTKRVN